jgi:hypothetical protein
VERLRRTVREARVLEEGEVEELLEILEHAIRTQFCVFGTDEASDTAVRRAMAAGFTSFLVQLRQVAQESVSADGSSVAFNRDGEFTWPALVGMILRSVQDESADVVDITHFVR